MVSSSAYYFSHCWITDLLNMKQKQNCKLKSVKFCKTTKLILFLNYLQISIHLNIKWHRVIFIIRIAKVAFLSPLVIKHHATMWFCKQLLLAESNFLMCFQNRDELEVILGHRFPAFIAYPQIFRTLKLLLKVTVGQKTISHHAWANGSLRIGLLGIPKVGWDDKTLGETITSPYSFALWLHHWSQRATLEIKRFHIPNTTIFEGANEANIFDV
jgi:hypothetical protein